MANAIIPFSPFIDAITNRPSREWWLWLQNPSVTSITISTAIGITSGGTGLSTLPTDGQLLIGDTSAYTLNTLTPSTGIGITNGAGSITIANTGVLSFSADSTGLTPATATTGNVVLGGTLNVLHGGTGQTSYTNGQLLIGNTTGNTLTKATLTAGSGIGITNGSGAITVANTGVLSFSAGTTGLTPNSATTGAVTLAGTLAVANGGTGATTASDARTNLGLGTIATKNTGATGTFTTVDLKTVTVTDGIIVSIV